MVSSTSLRKAHFLAQVGIETGWWQNREEVGNERYFRTMYELITPAEAGEDYDRAVALQRNLPSGRRPVELPNSDSKPRPTINRKDYMATRPDQILKKAAGMDNGVANSANGGLAGDGNRFRGRGFLQITGRRNYTDYGRYRSQNFTTEPNYRLLATSDYNACDTSGFYWARERVSKYCDRGHLPENVRQVGSVINLGNPNGTPLHNDLRLSAFNTIWSKSHD